MLKVEKLNEKLLKDVSGGVTARKVGSGIAIGALGLLGAALVTELVAETINLASVIYLDKAEDADNCEEGKKYLKKAFKLQTLANDIGTFGYSAARRRRNGSTELEDILEEIDNLC